jgi:DNA helicase-2/ATP-dependent DNA helicase PcrA
LQISYLENLNLPQRNAVEHLEGALLVLAGAGTGKTRVLTARIAHILATQSAYPSQILAVTFTNKAAKEMRSRIEKFSSDYATSGMWLGTFHSLCLRMIRDDANYARLGLESNFSIIDADDQHRLIKTLISENFTEDKKIIGKAVCGFINRMKDKALNTEQAKKIYNTGEREGVYTHLYELYQEKLKALNALDFGDLILKAKDLLEIREVAEHYQRKFHYILVDEYQDTNVAQYLWLQLLAGREENPNICCVGDDDQSIYGWRGAEVENILKFEQDFPRAKTIRLETNYRSTPHILGAASALIAFNRDRLGKKLCHPGENSNEENGKKENGNNFSSSNTGNKVNLVQLWDDKEEARYIASEIESLQQIRGQNLDEVAILVRAGFQTRSFEDAFMHYNVAYKIIGGLRFYERQEIKDAICYIRSVFQERNDLAFERVINLPKRGIGNKTMSDLREIARSNGVCLQRAAKIFCENGRINAAKMAISAMLANFKHQRQKAELATQNINASIGDISDATAGGIGGVSAIKLSQLVEDILTSSGYMQMWESQKNLEASARVENLKELIRAMDDFATMEEFLEYVSLVTENEVTSAETGQATVSLMTMHAAKGLEFETIFLSGWEEGLFPSQRSLDESANKGLEEERRLAYVGITRAKQNLYITFAGHRKIYGNFVNSLPSRFIDEIPREHVNLINMFSKNYART